MSESKLSSATVHEAAGRMGALPSSIKPVDPKMRLVGPAYPVASAPGDNLWLHRAIYSARPGDVLVVNAGGGLEHGYWGEIMVEAALARSLTGLVIHGGVRDSERLIEIGWPVFADRLCIRGTGKSSGAAGTLGEPIRVGEVDIGLGDLVVGDADGVVVIPADRAAEVTASAVAREQKEAEVIGRLRAGESTLDIYGLR